MFSFGQRAQPATSAASTAAPALFSAAPSSFNLFQQPFQQQQQQQQQTPAVSITVKTKYNELPADAQKAVDDIEKMVSEQKRTSDLISSLLTQELIDDMTSQVQTFRKTYSSMKTALEKDTKSVQKMKSAVNDEMKHMETAARIVDLLKNPNAPGHAYLNFYSTIEYFRHRVTEFEVRMLQYRQALEEMETHLATFVDHRQPSPAVIASVMQSQNELFLMMAGRVAALHDSIEKQREHYLMFRSKFLGDYHSPFSTTKRKGGLDDDGVSYKDYANEYLQPTGILPTTAAAPASSFGFSVGNNNNAFKPQVSSFSFGNSLTQPGTVTAPAVSTTGGLFGGNSGGFSFGATSTGTAAASALSFGSLSTTPQTMTTTASAPAFGTGMFGAPTVTTARPGGLFGSTLTQVMPTSSQPLFGQSANQPTNTGFSLASAATPAFGGFSFKT